ncbi:hypothetical protein BDV98DRAFT_281801 [Pterulicium gracile]|uniref:Uncharacterized protein n=1 Tax=Pterulicium gracile TaxID=1884261 RepID=A0A5C3QUG9_9AGAR|nr:hypothetical protein BDV98DRAFT_281801 [Pterula gracilis]
MTYLCKESVARWESLRFCSEEGGIYYQTFTCTTPATMHFEVLRRLEYRSDSDRDISLEHHFDASALPSLTSLQVERWAGDVIDSVANVLHGPRKATFPWSQLQQVYLHHYEGDADPVLGLLYHCTSLVSFRVSVRESLCKGHILSHPLSHDDQDSMVALPNLTHLDLGVTDAFWSTESCRSAGIFPIWMRNRRIPTRLSLNTFPLSMRFSSSTLSTPWKTPGLSSITC